MCNYHSEGLFRLGVLLGSPTFFLYVSCDRKGFENLMFPLWFPFLGSSFVSLNVHISLLFIVFSLLWVLWLFYDCQGFIIIVINYRTQIQ
jgi:hypothetical protein